MLFIYFVSAILVLLLTNKKNEEEMIINLSFNEKEYNFAAVWIAPIPIINTLFAIYLIFNLIKKQDKE